MPAHSALTGSDLHEPKGVAAATSGQIDVADGAGSQAWTTPTLAITAPDVLATATEVNRHTDVSTRLVAATGTLAMSLASHDGKTIQLDTTGGSVCTLPASTGSGAVYKFVVKTLATSNSHIVKVANASDIIQGVVATIDTDTAGTITGWATAADSDTITLNRSTSGSVMRGEYLEIQDIATNVYVVRGMLSNTGGGVTPFSATV